MKIGMTVAVGPCAEPQYARAFAMRAEQLGVESLWAGEKVVVPTKYEGGYGYTASGRFPGDGKLAVPDPLIWLACAAGATTRINLGTGILLLPMRNPVLLAKQCATLDRLSDGRFQLGIGVGWIKEEFDAVGVPWSRRGARADDYIMAMRALWTNDVASYHGEFVDFEAVWCNPRPMRRDGVPLVVGGHSEPGARRAGRFGDGLLVAGTNLKLIDVMREAAMESGRDPDSVEVSAYSPWGFNAPEDRGEIERVLQEFAMAGVSRMVVVTSHGEEPALDREFDLLGRVIAVAKQFDD